MLEKINWQNPKAPLLVRWTSTNSAGPCSYHVHSSIIELYFVRRGGGRFLIGNRFYPFYNNCALAVRPRQKHQSFPEPHKYQQVILLMAEQSLISKFMSSRQLQKLPPLVVISEPEMEKIELWCRIIAGEIRHPETTCSQLIANDLENILLVLKRSKRGITEEPIIDSRIRKAIDIIEANCSRHLPVNDVAAAVAMSPSHLSHCFTQQVKMSIKQYQLKCRIALAQQRLETDCAMKMSTLSDQLGFSDLSAFMRHFKHFAGMTPGDYRRMARLNRTS
jgi:AraC-like DNA-binding protein